MKLLGISAHTDDIELAAGGKLIKDLENGNEIKTIAFSYCHESLPNIYPKDKLKKEFELSMKTVGIKDYEIFNFPVRRFSEVRQDILEELIKIKTDFNPDVVITHSHNDIHQDHQIIAIETIRAFKNSASILAMQMPHNNLEFRNQYYERLNKEHIEKKIMMIEQYESQIYLRRKIFDEEKIWAWAKLNGFCCNSEFAEVFEVIRIIQ